MRKVPNLSISPEKVLFIVAKSRQSDGKATESDLVTESSDDRLEDHARTLIARSFPASFEA